MNSHHELYEKQLDELEIIRKSKLYIEGNLYQQGLIDGAIIQLIKLIELKEIE